MTYLSVKEAGRIVGKNERTIRRWINHDKVKWTKIKGKYHVDDKSLEQFTKITEKANHNNSQKKAANNSGQKTADKKKSGIDKRYVRIPKEKYLQLVKNIRKNSTGSPYTIKNEKLKEGQEYILMSGGQNMSDYQDHNMSVNNLLRSPIVSQEVVLPPVEMSADSDVNMSDISYDSLVALSDDVRHNDMTASDGHLSPFSDMSVDNQIDRHGTIFSENPFSDDVNKYGKDVPGHLHDVSGHNFRTVELSGYASRLIDEKERVANRFEQQNEFLKNELTALRKEISALRDIVGSEKEKGASMAQILLEDNRQIQARLEENYELRITNYENQLRLRNNKLSDHPVETLHATSNTEHGRNLNNASTRESNHKNSSYICSCHQPGEMVFDSKYYIIGFWLFAILILIAAIFAIGWLIF